MALQLDWIDNKTGVTYEDAYAIIGRILYTKLNNNSHQFVAKIKVYKDETAKSNGKSPIAEVQFTVTKTINSGDNTANQRNIINQIYNDMKDEEPWDDATDV